jgi:excisionase family DNA binding protein
VSEIIIVFTGIIPANAKGNTMENALAHTIAEASARSGIGRTAIYELINTGQLPARKRGRRTLILADDLRQCLQALPAVKVKSKLVSEKENVS